MSQLLHVSYAAVLILTLCCLVLCDFRYQLVWWQDRRRAARVLAVSIAVFCIWDLLGIQLGIFFPGATQYLSGIWLAPGFPIEELLFLSVLTYTPLLLWQGSKQWLAR